MSSYDEKRFLLLTQTGNMLIFDMLLSHTIILMEKTNSPYQIQNIVLSC